jgi:uncharacterized membrane protein required for colicin V production
MDLGAGLLVDVVILAIIIWKLVSGVRNGAVRMLGGIVSLGCGIYAGGLLRNMFAETVAQRWLVPAMRNLLNTAMDRLGLSDLPDNLRKILEETRLPGFLKTDVLDQALTRLKETGETALGSAAELIAQRLAGWILFILGFILVTLLVRILFNGVVDPVISGLPVLNEANKFLGGLLGAVLGIVIAGLVFALCYRLLPILSQRAGSIFSDRSIQGSILAKLYFRLLPGAFKS